MNRDDRIHGALLILNELVRISSMEGEVRNCVWGAQALCLLSAGREGPCALSQQIGSCQVAASPVKAMEQAVG